MYGAGDVIAVLDAFELGLLDQDWVNDIWRERFTTCPDDLPNDYSENHPLMNVTDTIEIMKQCQKVIKGWLKSDPTSRAQGSAALASWSALGEVQHRHLLALLYFYIKKAAANIKNFHMAVLGMKTTEFYLCLLSIEGSSVYNMFQISMFEACMETFNVYKHLDKLYTGKSSKSKKTVDNSDDEDFEEMNAAQQREALEFLNHLLVEFKNFVGVFSFKKHDEALRISLSILGDLSRVERDTTVERFLMAQKGFSVLTRNAYLTMLEFCKELHGRVPEMVRLVLHKIMPNLSLIGGSEYPEIARWSNAEQSTVRNLALWFLKSCILPLGEPTHISIKILIQHLCRQMNERADYRGKATDMVISIMMQLPETLYFAMLKWIFRETLAEYTNHRVVAVELLSKLIYLKQGSIERSNMDENGDSNMAEASSASEGESSNSTSSRRPSEGGAGLTSTLAPLAADATDATDSSSSQERVVSFCKPLEFVPIEYRRMMLALIVDRLRDNAVSVRAKALNVLGDILSNRVSPTVQALVRAIFVAPYKNQAEIDVNAKEKEFLKGNQLVAALTEPNIAVSSKQVLPGGTRIVAMILQKCLEERVVVRRAALSAIVQVFKLNPQWMTRHNLELFGQHCRDPAMQVRKEMVGSVTDLMLHFPNNQQLTRLWVEEVVPQVGDREIRVQEHALKILTSVILANIKMQQRTLSPTDELPWQLINHIATLKMRSFLVSSCRLWRDSRTPELNQQKIGAILSHIGGPHDAPAWVLLASLTEFVDIADPTPVVNYYMDVVSKGEGNAGIHHLVMMTLNNVWPKLKNDKQVELQKQLYERLKSGDVAPKLVPLLVKTATSMTVTLSSDEPQGRKEVAMWAVETVQECERHLEHCLDAGNSDRGNCTSCTFYLILLGSLADLHPEHINHNTFELIYSFLISAKSARNSGVSKLKIVSVLALARMALREKRIASRLVAGLSTLITNYTDPVLLINVIVSIADIGERFPNLIEPLVPSLSLSLRNRHREVREMALIITIDLLQEDYLKARGALIYHLLSLINEPAPRTVSIVKFYFTNCLLPRTTAPEDLIVRALFHYNKVYSFSGYKKLAMEEAEEVAFNMSGPKFHKKRLAVYRFLLNQFKLMLRMRCFVSIGNTVLDGITSHGINPATTEGENLIVDAFTFLMGHEFRIENADASKKKDDSDDEDESDKASKDKAADAATKAMLSAVHKNVLQEKIIPLCSKARKVLVKHRPLLTRLYAFVRETVRDYKNEIDDLFRDDRQFGQEIAHELKTTNRAQEEEEFAQFFAEPNPQTVQAELREEVAETSVRLAKRKSDENNQEGSKKRKSDEARMIMEDFGGNPDSVLARNRSEGSLLNEMQEAIEQARGESFQLEELQEALDNERNSVEEPRRKGRSGEKSKSTSLIMPPPEDDSRPRRRRGKASSVCSEDSEMQDLIGELPGDMPPPRRQSKRSSTPTIAGKQPICSSTPVLKSSMPPPGEEAKPRRRKGKASSVCSDDSEMQDSLKDLPDNVPSASRRQSKKSVATPTVPSRKPSMLSSTPLIANQQGFETMDISPVVQNSRNETS